MARLVLADSNPSVQQVVQLCFSEADDHVRVFVDGPSALTHLETEAVDIVLADVSLDGLDGYQLCRAIKRNPAIGHIPVVLLVGARARMDSELATEVGCDRQLSKPVDTIQLVDLVKELIQHSRSSTPVSPSATVPVVTPATSSFGHVGWVVDLSSLTCHSRPPLYQRCGDDAAASDSSGLDPLSDKFLERVVNRLRQEFPKILEDAAGDLRQGNKN